MLGFLICGLRLMLSVDVKVKYKEIEGIFNELDFEIPNWIDNVTRVIFAALYPTSV